MSLQEMTVTMNLRLPSPKVMCVSASSSPPSVTSTPGPVVPTLRSLCLKGKDLFFDNQSAVKEENPELFLAFKTFLWLTLIIIRWSIAENIRSIC